MLIRVALSLALILYCSPGVSGQDELLKVELNPEGGPTVSIVANWSSPKCNWGSVSTYRVEFCKDDGSCTERTTNMSVKTYTLAGAPYWTNYTVTVIADCASQGDIVVGKTFMNTGPGQLFPPNSLTATAGDRFATLYWNENSKYAYQATHYLVEICRPGKACEETERERVLPVGNATQQQSFTVIDRVAGVQYEARVYAMAKAGGDRHNSTRIDILFSSNPPDDEVYAPVRDLNVTVTDFTTAEITFKKTSKETSLAHVLIYNDFQTLIAETRTNNTNVTFKSLPPFSQLTVEVFAIYQVNDDNISSRGLKSNFSTGGGIGDIVNPVVSVTGIYRDQILVQWTHQKAETVDYEYIISWGNDEASKVNISKPKEYFTIIKGLKANTMYKVTVMATVNYKGYTYTRLSDAMSVYTLDKGALTPGDLKLQGIDSLGAHLSWTIPPGVVHRNCTFLVFSCPAANGTSCKTVVDIPWNVANASVHFAPFQNHAFFVHGTCRFMDSIEVYEESHVLQAFTAYAPSSVKMVKVNEMSQSHMLIMWSPEESDTDYIRGYTVDYIAYANDTKGLKTVTTNETIIQIDDLVQQTTYKINITAYTVDPIKNESLFGIPYVMNSTTSYAPPSGVQNLRASQVGNTPNVDIEWQKPNETYTPIQYIVDVNCNVSGFSINRRTRDLSVRVQFSARNQEKCDINVTSSTVDVGADKHGPTVTTTHDYRGIEPPRSVKYIKANETHVWLDVEQPTTTKGKDVSYQCGRNGTIYPSPPSSDSQCIIWLPEPSKPFPVKARVCLGPWCGDDYEKMVTTNVGTPGVVGNLDIVIQNDTDLLITWMEPSIKKGPISGYHLTITDTEKKKITEATNEGHEVSYRHNTTNEYAPYTVVVWAYNFDKDNDTYQHEGPSASMSITSSGKSSPPPTAIVNSDVTTKSAGLSLKWTPTPDSRFNDSWYMVDITVAGSNEANTFASGVGRYFTKDTLLSVVSLQAYTGYDIFISSCKKKDDQSTCGRATNTTLRTAADHPTQPLNLTVTARMSHAITVEWAPPEKPNGPLVADGGYDIACVKGDEDPKDWLPLKGSAVNHTFEKLDEATSYTIHLKAYNTVNKKQLYSPNVVFKTDTVGKTGHNGWYVILGIGIAVAVAIIGYVSYKKIKNAPADRQVLVSNPEIILHNDERPGTSFKIAS